MKAEIKRDNCYSSDRATKKTTGGSREISPKTTALCLAHTNIDKNEASENLAAAAEEWQIVSDDLNEA